MAVMTALHRFIFALTLGLIACDESPKAKAPEVSHSPRSSSPSAATSPAPNERLRSTLREAQGLGTQEQRNQALAGVAWDALDLDHDLALEAFSQMTPASEERDRLLEHFVMRAAEVSVDDAVKWANSLSTDAEKSLAMGKIALVVSEKEPERAAAMISESGVAGHDLDVAVVQVVQRWAATSPEAAAGWLSLFKAGDARSTGFEQVIAVWIQRDAAAACAWIPTLKDAKMRQEAEMGAALAIHNAPESAQGEMLGIAPLAIRSLVKNLAIRASAAPTR
jgi:hypothetical protein